MKKRGIKQTQVWMAVILGFLVAMLIMAIVLGAIGSRSDNPISLDGISEIARRAKESSAELFVMGVAAVLAVVRERIK